MRLKYCAPGMESGNETEILCSGNETEILCSGNGVWE